MRMTYLDEEIDQHYFVRRAAAHFAEHPEHWTYADADPEPGQFLALRWGGRNDCVLLVKLDACFEPVNFQELIPLILVPSDTRP